MVRAPAIGCMRLSTAPDRDEARGIAVLHAAFAAGVTLLDTADAYCHDDTEAGHNERLIAAAIRSWRGDTSRLKVATKGGLIRPGGRWETDGRARALTSACEASLRALGVDRIDLYQLHVVDPRVPLATSVRALDRVKRRGKIAAIGLCNVTVGQIEEARSITEVASVQVELNLWQDASVLGGLVEYCTTHQIPLLAYRPLGGPELRRRIASDPLLNEIAANHDATPFEVALAAIADLSPVVVPLPGPTRTGTAQSAGRLSRIVLRDEDRTRLQDRFPACRAMVGRANALKPGPSAGPGSSYPAPVVSSPESQTPSPAEIVLVMGLPGAGKSTVAAQLACEGYARLNRDDAGGSLKALLPVLAGQVATGATRFVLDNTYVTRKARGAVIQAARRHGLAVRCVWLTTSIEDAQVNAVTRLVAKYGRLPGPEELKAAAKSDPAAFPPTVQFRYQRELEPPDASEGFSRIDVIPFERRRHPRLVHRALLIWCDGVLLRSRSGHRVPRSLADTEVAVERGAILRQHAKEGWRVLGLSWLPEIAEGTMRAEDADTIFAALAEALGVPIEVGYCPHPAGPPVCWCRKPLPGLGVVFQERYALDPSACLYVGSGAQDPGFARRLGFGYAEGGSFFG